MTETLQLEQVKIISSDLHDAPKLLVEWTPRWQNFVTSIGPALARSGPPLAGEAPPGGMPYRGLTASLLLQLALLFAGLALPREIDRLRPYAAPKLRPYEVIYYSGDELPRTEDLSGAESGKTATAGGQEARHRTQTIRIARGNALTGKVVDAPNLKLPSSAENVANLLALKSSPALPAVPAAPSADGLHSSLTAPALAAKVIAPAPVDVNAAHSRNRLTLSSVVPPAPSVSAENSRSAPKLNSAVVPPAPVAPSEHALIAPRLDSSIIAPAPTVSRRDPFATPSLNANVIAPAPTNVSNQARSTPALSASVVPPAPTTSGPEVPSTRVRMTNVAVVPPPVSTPEREEARKAKLNLPAPSIVAPPPSADSAHDLRRLESGVATSSPTVVPPPPTQAPSFMSNIIGKIFGTQDVVPPPPSVTSGNRASGSALGTNVVPPPPSVSASNRSGSGTLTSNVVPPPPNVSSGNRGSANTLAANIVPPPPSAAETSAAGISRVAPHAPGGKVVAPPPSVNGYEAPRSAPATTATRGSLRPDVVPPPPSVGEASAGIAANQNGMNGLANNIVPPPPPVTSSSPTSARKNAGLGDATVLAPPKPANGNNDASGIVASARPGSNVAVPGNTAKNALAMSPTGADKPGLGGSGAGTGIGNSKGSGSGLATEKPAENTGAGKTGSGHGFDQTARTGISTTPGPGGSGSLAAGSPAVPGVDVRGGSTIVTLPSFGSDGGDPNLPRRTNVKTAQGPAITIVATSRSGGAFNFYGELPGDNYTVYVDTTIGTVVMQFAEANQTRHPSDETLTGPEAIRADLPASLGHSRVVVKCKLDASGNITNLRVLEPGPAGMTAKIVAALPGWKFRPAMRGSQPVEINAILGFNINTADRY